MQVRGEAKRLSSISRKLQTLGLTVILPVAIFSCGLEKPESPNWTVDLMVPIANRHVDGPYIASHAGSDYLRWHDDSGLVWSIAAELDTVTLAGHLTVTPPPASGEFALGSVKVGTGTLLSCQFALEDVTPLAAGTVPELTTSLNAALPQAPSFDSVAGASGTLRLEIENELGVTVDQVTVTLLSGAGSSIAVMAVDGAIPSGETRVVDHVISGLSLGDDWNVSLGFHTPGGTVLSAADKYIAVQTSFPDGITASYARGVIDAMDKQFEDELSLSTTHTLSSAAILQGDLILGWTNNTPLPVTVSWESSQIEITGQRFSGEAVFPPYASSVFPIGLGGALYTSSDSPSHATVDVSVQSIGSNGGTVEVSSAQTVSYTLEWSELELSSAVGVIAATQVESGLLSASLDWESGLQNAGLDRWNAFLLLSSSLPLSAQLTGQISSNTGLNLPFSGVIPASAGTITSVRLPIETSTSILQPLPSQLQFSGIVSFGGGQQAVSIAASDFVSASIEFGAPAHMYVDDVTLEIDPTSVSLSGEDFGDRTGRLMNAVVTVSIANRFPLGGGFTLRVAADSAGLDADDALLLGPSTLAPARTDANGNAVSVATTELTYVLDSADLVLFEREVVWFAETLTLLGPGQGQPARISTSDVLEWNAHVRLEMKVDSDVRPWEN